MKKTEFKMKIVLLLTIGIMFGVSVIPFPNNSLPLDTLWAAPEKREIILVTDMSLGSSEGARFIKEHKYTIDASETDTNATIIGIAKGLTELTGLNFAVESGKVDTKATVVWSPKASCIAGLGDIVQKEDFFVYDNESLVWFMLDSMYQTILRTFGGHGKEISVYYSVAGGAPLKLPNGIEITGEDPYMGSAFYAAHNDLIGDMSEVYNWWGAFRSADNDNTLHISNLDINQEGIGNFSFTIISKEGEEFGGVAAIADDSSTADYMDLVFKITKDSNSISISQENPQSEAATRKVFSGNYSRADD
ncbi:MAG: hypothetical protein LBF22_06725 [Deltaproteobacteria bacterium]|jgi:hypothetical protein|nr:hypothetical protein [Deltaproteobacteria bacterium]